MLETFDDATGWAAGTGVANVETDTGTVKQGTSSIEFDKTGTGQDTASITKNRGVPCSIQALRQSLKAPQVRCWFYHADFTNFSKISVRFTYRYDSAGMADRTEEWDLSSFTGGQWNELSGNLDSPDTVSATPPDDGDRANLIAYSIIVTMDAAANTFSDLFVDALHVRPSSDEDAPPGVLVFDGQRILVPPFDVWNRNTDQKSQINVSEAASEVLLKRRKQTIEFGLSQARKTFMGSTALAHGLEDSLRMFGQYIGESDGWGVGWPAEQTLDTTLNTAAAVVDLSLDLVDIEDVDFIVDGGRELDIRIGPNDSRQYEIARILSTSGNTAYLDRPLRYAHEAGTKVRALNHYPNCVAMPGQSFPVVEGQSVVFKAKGVESD